MNKKQYEAWVVKADNALKESNLFKDENKQEIYKSYNGYIAALGVSILTMGLKPTLCIYYQDNNDGVCRKKVLDVIAKMIGEKNAKNLNAKNLLETTLSKKSTEDQLKDLQRSVIESSVALKQVVRTYKLVDTDE